MTRRAVIAGVLAVCITAVLVGGIAYLRYSADIEGGVDAELVSLAAHPLVLLSDRSALVQVRASDGSVRYRSSALAKLGTLPREAPGYVTKTVAHRSLRIYTRGLGSGRRLSVALDSAAHEALPRLRRGILTGILVGGVIVSLALVVIMRRALAPIRRTAEVADEITRTNDLRARVPEAPGSDEVAQLTRSINRMLDHLESRDAALRRLVADASHELRSPITTLRGNLEQLSGGVALSPGDRDEALADARFETERLQRLVEGLLALARADAMPELQRLRITELLDELAPEDVRIAAAAAQAAVRGDALALRAAIRNLIENAAKYAGGGELTVDADEREVTLRVIDHGPGIPAAEREQIFRRFARGSSAQGLPGSGLGLAIVAATVRSHGGRTRIEDTPGGGATVALVLPRDNSTICTSDPV